MQRRVQCGRQSGARECACARRGAQQKSAGASKRQPMRVPYAVPSRKGAFHGDASRVGAESEHVAVSGAKISKQKICYRKRRVRHDIVVAESARREEIFAPALLMFR